MKLKNPYVVIFIDLFVADNKTCIVTEFCEVNQVIFI